MAGSSGPAEAVSLVLGRVVFCGLLAGCEAGQSEWIMSDAARVRVEPRDPAKNKGTGTRVARRLRAKGRIPAVIYGHKQAVVPDHPARDDVWRMIKTPGHLADLDVGGTTETVLIRDVQWDHLGKEILHLDFARVSAEEMIETEVPLELRGQAAGIAAGGILEHLCAQPADHLPSRRDSRFDQG